MFIHPQFSLRCTVVKIAVIFVEAISQGDSFWVVTQVYSLDTGK